MSSVFTDRNHKHFLQSALTTNKMVFTAGIIWIVILAASFAWNWHQVGNTMRFLAEKEARTAFKKDVVYRQWAANHGGVYVQPTENSPPNPYLDHLPDRDLTTASGKELTLINPAYMTRQVHELAQEQYGLMGHITSLDPIRPENAADAWETQALQSFQKGTKQAASVQTMDNQPYFRFMQPLVTKKSCLSCHAQQGYTVGDIQGGISVSVPMKAYLSQAGNQRRSLALVHILIGGLGLVGLWTAHRQLRGSQVKLCQNQEHLSATLRSIGDGVISCDNKGHIQNLNPAAENLTGWSLDKCMGHTFEKIFNIVDFRDHSKKENPVYTALQQGQSVDQATHSVLISRDGRKITIEKSCSPIRDNTGSIVGAVLVFRDVTREHTANLLTQKRLELYDYAAVHSLDELMTKVLDDAEEFVDSCIGFFHFVETDQKTLSLQRWSTRSLQELCHMPGNKMHYSIDQAGVWVQAAREKRPVIHNDYESMPDKTGLPEGHARVIREVVVPVIRENKVVAIMGLGNKPVDYDEKDLEVISFFADITWDLVDQKRTQEALQNSQARLKTITDAAQSAIIMIDAQGSVSYWNPAAETILGYARDEAMGRDLHQLIMPSRYTKDFEASFPVFQDTGQGDAVGRTTELYALTKNGREIPVELGLSSVRIHGQWHAIGIVRDITEKKQAQEELQRNARNLELKNAELDAARIKAEEATRAKSEFLANMSHEIRTPMNGVIGMTGLLMDTNLDRDQEHYARTVRTSAESLLTVINDILDFSKIEAGRLDMETVDFDLEAMLMDFSGMMAVKAEEKGLEFICSMDPDVPSLVHGDPGRLRQILMNLAGNAVKFTEQGEVEIRVQKAEVNGQRLAARGQEAEAQGSRGKDSAVNDIRDPLNREASVLLRFTVRDTGIGIPEDKIDLLFNKFSQVDTSITRKFGGTGLGLAISRQLAELMGGTVGLESLEGQGSIFWFTARLDLQGVQQEQPAPACLQGVRALIVDDNATNREILRVRLGTWDMRPEESSNGPAALSMLRQAQADNDPFVVAVLDMMMPDMDGETLGRKIKEDEQVKDTRLIMMSSATGQTGDAKRLQKTGFDLILSKPVLPSELHASLEKVLAKTGAIDLIAEHAEQEETRQGYPDFSGTKVRILVAEDNVVNQQVALGILKKMGLRADVVANGQEAIHALDNIPYDLVLMDVQMPEMDGLEATRRIREIMHTEHSEFQNSKIPQSFNNRIPIIAMTAAAMQQDMDNCFEAGMDDYISKPVNPDALVRILDKWLKPKTRSQETETEANEQGTEAWKNSSGSQYTKIFDREAFMERISDDTDFAIEILTMHKEYMPQSMKSIKNNIEQGKIKAALRDAHSIKGNSANCGCMAVAATAQQMEKAAQSENFAEMKDLLTELEKQFELCMAEIQKHFVL